MTHQEGVLHIPHMAQLSPYTVIRACLETSSHKQNVLYVKGKGPFHQELENVCPPAEERENKKKWKESSTNGGGQDVIILQCSE